MKQAKALNVAIVGGGPGCKAIMDMIFAKKLSQLRMKLIGVACTNPKAVGYRYAQEKGIFTTRDYRDLYKLKNLNMIIELTGRQEVADEIFQTKPENVRLMGNVAARLFWDLFKIEEDLITKRERTEEALRQSEERYRTLFMNNPIETIIVDLEGRVTGFNKAKEKGAKERPNDRLPNLGDRMYTKDYAGRHKINMRKELMNCIRSGKSKDFPELKYDDRFLYINISPFRDGAIITSIDITNRKQAEEALRESELKFRDMFGLSPQPIALTEIETGRLIDINDMFCELTKYTKEEILGRTTMECGFYSEKDRARFIKELQKSGEVLGLEMDFRAKDGSIITALMFSKIVTIGGKPLILTMFVDMTGHKDLEAQLLQAQKMEAIGTLAGGIAHDFNNLLMGIQGNVSLMLMDADSAHPYYERLQNVERQIQSGIRLTSHLLGYARKGKYEVKPVNLNQLVKETSETFGRTRKDITIRQELAKNLFPIEADQGQIEQVLFNLYVNAGDAMAGGGDLNLKTMNVAHGNMEGKLYDPKPGNYVMLTVTDTGTGMNKKTMERIFDPFFTTKEMGRGTGLGLASTYGIIKSHAGYIDVDSKKGHGTTFSIYLPASEKPAHKAVKRADQVLKGTETVLLVDDEEEIRQVGKDLLEAMGYQVLLATDGKEAVKLYKKHRDDIEIVLLDMVMPNMGGGETYDTMKKINPEIKALLFSGYSITGKATEILERGCNGFLQKPFTMKALSGKIREILEGE